MVVKIVIYHQYHQSSDTHDWLAHNQDKSLAVRRRFFILLS